MKLHTLTHKVSLFFEWKILLFFIIVVDVFFGFRLYNYPLLLIEYMASTSSSQQWPVVFQSFYIHKISFYHLGIIAMLLSHDTMFTSIIACCCVVLASVGHCVLIFSLTGFRCFFFFHCFWTSSICVSAWYFSSVFNHLLPPFYHWTAEIWKRVNVQQ